MDTTGMCIIEQVNRVMLDMQQLLDDLHNTDSENMDFNQLKVLSNFSSAYSKDIDYLIKDREED